MPYCGSTCGSGEGGECPPLPGIVAVQVYDAVVPGRWHSNPRGWMMVAFVCKFADLPWLRSRSQNKLELSCKSTQCFALTQSKQTQPRGRIVQMITPVLL
jgi:hypothetical protein